MLPRAASDHQRQQTGLILETVRVVRREWARMGDDLDASWARVGPRVAFLTASAQLGSARNGIAYVGSVLDEQGTPVAPEARIDPRGLAGLASDGRSLESLLYSAVVRARSAKVETLPQRLDIGRSWLDAIVQTQVADAGRDAAKVAMTVRPGVKWVRIVTPPCCQRCAPLAGRVYSHAQAFKRHPRCDCTMLPQTVADPFAAGRTIAPEDITDLTRRQKLAIASGQNLNRVVNDYQRKRGAFSDLPPTRVEQVVTRAGQREKAIDALREIGIVL